MEYLCIEEGRMETNPKDVRFKVGSVYLELFNPDGLLTLRDEKKRIHEVGGGWQKKFIPKPNLLPCGWFKLRSIIKPKNK